MKFGSTVLILLLPCLVHAQESSIEFPQWGQLGSQIMKVNDDTIQDWFGAKRSGLTRTKITFNKDIVINSPLTEQYKNAYITFSGRLFFANGSFINNKRPIGEPRDMAGELRQLIPESMSDEFSSPLKYPFTNHCQISKVYADSLDETSATVGLAGTSTDIYQMEAFRYIDSDTQNIVTMVRGAFSATGAKRGFTIECYFPIATRSHGNELRSLMQETFGDWITVHPYIKE